MLHFPLLSDAYEAALLGADELRPKTAAHPPSHPRPCPAPPEHSKPGIGGEENHGADSTEDLPDDMETARTRPLRLDRLHL